MNTVNTQQFSNQKYDIVRFYFDSSKSSRIILRNLTLEEAQRHCNDIETSSSTCTLPSKKAITRRNGAWFDGYQKSR
jgi:hypothetical protein